MCEREARGCEWEGSGMKGVRKNYEKEGEGVDVKDGRLKGQGRGRRREMNAEGKRRKTRVNTREGSKRKRREGNDWAWKT